MKKTTLQEIKRKLIQAAAFGYSNFHAENFITGKLYNGNWKNFCNPGINCYSCPAAHLSCPIGAMQAVEGSKQFSFSFYVVGFILAVGVIFGRAVCGYVCPFGLIQDLLALIPVPKFRLPKAFTYIKYVLLAVFVICLPILLPLITKSPMGLSAPAFCQYICPAGTLEGGIPLLLTHEELRSTLGWLFYLKLSILILTIGGCIVNRKFFCKTMCPLGAIYGLLNKISLLQLKIDRKKCVSCGKCNTVCPMDADPLHNLRSAECIRCGKCVAGCPENAIKLTFRIKETERHSADTPLS